MHDAVRRVVTVLLRLLQLIGQVTPLLESGMRQLPEQRCAGDQIVRGAAEEEEEAIGTRREADPHGVLLAG